MKGGVVVNTSSGGRPRMSKAMEACAIAGVDVMQFNMRWSYLQPEQDDFRFRDDYEKYLRLAAEYGKRCAFIVTCLSGKYRAGNTENGTTPTWVLDSVPTWGTSTGLVYPVLWSSEYLAHFEQLLTDLAAVCADWPGSVDNWRIGGWQISTNESARFFQGAEDDPEAFAFLDGVGGILNGDGNPDPTGTDVYTTAVLEMIQMWQDIMRPAGAHLALTANFKDPGELGYTFVQKMLTSCERRRISLLNTGLNENDHSGLRQVFSDYRGRGLACGWGGITHASINSNAELVEMVLEGLGDEVTHPPVARAAYITGKDTFLDEFDDEDGDDEGDFWLEYPSAAALAHDRIEFIS